MRPLSRYSRSVRYTSAALATVTVITLAQPAQAFFDWRRVLPRVLPNLIQTIQLSNISPRQESALGQQINRQLTRRQFRLLRDRNLTNYVNQIGQRIVRRNKTRKGITYKFQVVDDKSINAAATMGGYVYINKGLIRAATNEAELASVISHEIAHVKERHSIEQAKNTALARTGAAALNLSRNNLINLGMQFGLTLPRSRRFEFAADEIGLRLLTNAGYDPRASVSFMKKLDNGRRAPKWLSTHPPTPDRVRRLQALVNRISNPPRGGIDAVAYARRVGKPIPRVAPKSVRRSSSILPVDQPTVTPSARGVVVPTGSVVIPSEPVRRSQADFGASGSYVISVQSAN